MQMKSGMKKLSFRYRPWACMVMNQRKCLNEHAGLIPQKGVAGHRQSDDSVVIASQSDSPCVKPFSQEGRTTSLKRGRAGPQENAGRPKFLIGKQRNPTCHSSDASHHV